MPQSEMQSLLDQARSFEWASYELCFEVQGKGDLPAYLGSSLRGVFGHAFKEVVCLVNHRDCQKCLLSQRCPYPYVFETKRPGQAEMMTRYNQIPHPFVLIPPAPVSDKENPVQPGMLLRTSFRLFGPTRQMLPYFILGWEQMGDRGLGYQRVPLRLKSVNYLLDDGRSQSIYTPGCELSAGWEDLCQTLSQRPIQLSPLRLDLETPLRLSQQGRFLNRDLPFESLIASILRRLSMILYFHQQLRVEVDFKALTDAAAQVPVLRQELHFQDFNRWSNRQGKKMNLGGLMGHVIYAATAQDFAPLLRLGEILLAGKGTSFGLGRYRLSPVSPE